VSGSTDWTDALQQMENARNEVNNSLLNYSWQRSDLDMLIQSWSTPQVPLGVVGYIFALLDLETARNLVNWLWRAEILSILPWNHISTMQLTIVGVSWWRKSVRGMSSICNISLIDIW
jgi:hypothetical protein